MSEVAAGSKYLVRDYGDERSPLLTLAAVIFSFVSGGMTDPSPTMRLQIVDRVDNRILVTYKYSGDRGSYPGLEEHKRLLTKDLETLSATEFALAHLPADAH